MLQNRVDLEKKKKNYTWLIKQAGTVIKQLLILFRDKILSSDYWLGFNHLQQWTYPTVALNTLKYECELSHYWDFSQ